jgi:hypothetical protein
VLFEPGKPNAAGSSADNSKIATDRNVNASTASVKSKAVPANRAGGQQGQRKE